MTLDGINRAIKEARLDFRECEKRWEPVFYSNAGDVTVEFQLGVVDDVGRIVDVKAWGDEVEELPVLDCYMTVVQTLEFEVPPIEGMSVRWPLELSDL